MRAVFVVALALGLVSASTGTFAAGQLAPKKDIFANLFLNPQKPAAIPPPLPLKSPWRELPVTLVRAPLATACGLTLVAGNPSIDPGMPQALPNKAAQSTIRTIQAPDCGK